MANASSAEDRRSIEARYEDRLEAVERECEERQGSSASRQGERQPSRAQVQTAEDVIEWSEDYPEVPVIHIGNVSLSDEQTSIVKDNMVEALSNVEAHLPPQTPSACLERAREVAGETRGRVEDASTVETLVRMHATITEDMEAVMSSSECRPERTRTSQSSRATQTAEPRAQADRPGVQELPRAGQRISEDEVEAIRSTISSLKSEVRRYEQEVQALENRIDELQDRERERANDDAERGPDRVRRPVEPTDTTRPQQQRDAPRTETTVTADNETETSEPSPPRPEQDNQGRDTNQSGQREPADTEPQNRSNTDEPGVLRQIAGVLFN